MKTLRTDLTLDSTSSVPSRRPRRRWLRLGVTAASVAAVTAGLALVVQTENSSQETVVAQVDDSVPQPARALRTLTGSSRLELRGIGPIGVGMTLDEASAAAGKPLTIVPNSYAPGTGVCAHAVVEGGPEGLRFMVVHGRIVRVEAFRGTVATPEGITTGTPVEEVLAAYAGRIRVEPHTYTARRGGQYLIYDEAVGVNPLTLLFETDGTRVTMFRSGYTDAVMAPEGCG